MSVAPRHAGTAAVEAVPPSTPRRITTTPRGATVASTSSTDITPFVPFVRGFDAFAAELHNDIRPSTLLERVLTERVALAAWRLHLDSLEEANDARVAYNGTPSANALPPISRDVLRTEGSLETSVAMLQAVRRRPCWGKAASHDSKTGYEVPGVAGEGLDDQIGSLPDLSNEWTSIPSSSLDDNGPHRFDPDDDRSDEENGGDDDESHLLWRDRLVFDDKAADGSPVVRGTWVSAGHVVSLVVDGWTWSDVLRTHPELTEDDIRACLAYTVSRDACDEQ